jgi:hypothetical protein
MLLQPLQINAGAKLDIAWDWTAWLEDGDSIASQTVTVDSGLTMVSTTVGGAKVTAIVSVPGDAHQGATYTATCSITTAAGLIDAREYFLQILHR